ncbi:phosphatase PAP2 family protein [Lysobacter fragariae]
MRYPATPPPNDAPLPFGKRMGWVLAFLTAVTALYLGSNFHPLRAPQPLPLTIVDTAIGWHAWTIWPYWLLLVIAPGFLLSISNRRLLLATMGTYSLALGCDALVWLAWPTVLPRHVLPVDLDAATAGAWQLLYFLDGSNNCFPSAHITAPIVTLAGCAMQRPAAGRWGWPLIAVLAPSVVSTGQHYAWDVLGGAATAAMALWLMRDRMRRAASH